MDSSRSPADDDCSDPTPETWARRYRRGEPEAMCEVRQRIGRILGYRGVSIPPQDRDDLTQQVMSDIWQAVNATHFDFSGGFWGFVEVVTTRRCIDWLRAQREERSLPERLASPQAGPFAKVLEMERTELASMVMSRLDPDCRQLIALRMREELGYREIADETGKSEGALRVQFYRCIRRSRRLLRQIIENREDRGEGAARQ